jgi:hypothetical protein
MSSGKDRGKHDGRKDESGRAGHGRSGELGAPTPPPWEPRRPQAGESTNEPREGRSDAPPSPMGGTPGRHAPRRE